jgi:uncharacterized Tic20 family protein
VVYPAYTPPPPTGRFSWALGFLAYIPIPYLSLVIAAIVMWATYPSRSRHPSALVRDNARNAANWAITMLIIFVLCVTYIFVMMASPENRAGGFFPIGWGVIGFLGLGIAHLIVTIAGTVIGGTRVFRGPGIPFLRGPAPEASYQGLGVR